VPAETIWNYEAGIKGNAADNSLSYAVSMFYQDYQKTNHFIFLYILKNDDQITINYPTIV
jgi:outer membrane receptor for ferric coprogen and ferric-rhodotorulic acid